MTWNELARQIADMPPDQRRQNVRFIEPYDKDKAGFYIEIVKADEDIYIGPRDGDELFVNKGEPMLR